MTGLERLRGTKDWSQSELASRAGVKRTSLIRWERTGVVPKAHAAEKLAAAFGMSVERFLDEVRKSA